MIDKKYKSKIKLLEKQIGYQQYLMENAHFADSYGGQRKDFMARQKERSEAQIYAG